MDAITGKTRPYEFADYALLKSATHKAVKLAGPLAEVCRHTRLDAGTISRAGNMAESNFLPLDVAVDLDKLAGDDVILRAMARLRGYELVPIKKAHCAIDLVRDAGDAAKETGELVKAIADAARDGRYSPREAREIDGEAAEAEGVIASIRKRLHGFMAAGR